MPQDGNHKTSLNPVLTIWPRLKCCKYSIYSGFLYKWKISCVFSAETLSACFREESQENDGTGCTMQLDSFQRNDARGAQGPRSINLFTGKTNPNPYFVYTMLHTSRVICGTFFRFTSGAAIK